MKANTDNIGIEYEVHKLKQQSRVFFQARIPGAWDIIWCKYIVFLFQLNASKKAIQMKTAVEEIKLDTRKDCIYCDY